jgi:SnoaL-like domain
VTNNPLLEQLADRAALADLLARQGLWLDEQRYDDAHTVFTEDAAVHTQAGQSQGLEALAAHARRVHEVFTATQHLTSGVLIDIDGDHATVRANLVAVLMRGPAAEPAVVGERYRFEAVRTPGGWRFSRVDVTPVWRHGDVPRQS